MTRDGIARSQTCLNKRILSQDNRLLDLFVELNSIWICENKDLNVSCGKYCASVTTKSNTDNVLRIIESILVTYQ